MKTLALEFSAELRSAAVRAGSSTVACARECAPRECGPLTLIERALTESGIEREAIECVAVGLGPGSYAGIRTAIAVAQGWQLARQVRVLGLSSVDVLAAQAHAAGARGRINVVVDARRGELYWARYDLNTEGWTAVQTLRLARWPDLEAVIQQGERLASPNPGMLEHGVPILMPDAAMLAEIAARRDDHVAAESLEPIYLRLTSFVKAPAPREIPPIAQR